jgi:hypothetical protein
MMPFFPANIIKKERSMKFAALIIFLLIIIPILCCSNHSTRISSLASGPKTESVHLSDYQKVCYLSSTTGSYESGKAMRTEQIK